MGDITILYGFLQGKNMRTLSEVNRNIQKIKTDLNCAKTNKEYLFYKALLLELKDEKEIIWNSLFEGHRNYKIK